VPTSRAKICETARALTAALLVSAASSRLAADGPAAYQDQDTAEGRSAPTPVEQALIEHQCSATRATSPADTGAYDACLSTQLLSIRADFGRDLSRLSPPERRAVDAVCSRIRATEGREAYVGCLSAQLVSLRNRRNRTSTPPSEEPIAPQPAATVIAAAPSPPPKPRPLTFLWIGLPILALGGAAAGAVFAIKRRRPVTRCRVCATVVPGGGDLCQSCRHEAAEALRRASIEAEQQRDEERRREEERRQQEEEWQQDQARRKAQGEEARLRQEARVPPPEDEEVHKQLASEPSPAPVPEPAAFDPHVVLGIPPDANRETIESAYEEARSRYDAEHVAHLSEEVQQHFRMKAQAVERAYQMLTA
jgi:hypothetical protein